MCLIELDLGIQVGSALTPLLWHRDYVVAYSNSTIDTHFEMREPGNAP